LLILAGIGNTDDDAARWCEQLYAAALLGLDLAGEEIDVSVGNH
jgi:hypothetical protein